MLAAAIIVFREVLEAALIVGVVAAATRGVAGRGRWIAAGIAAGLAAAALVAVGAEAISAWASGVGQEIFNAGVLAMAVLMLAWHNLWMASHGRALAGQAREVAVAIRSGQRACPVLMAVIGLAVLREGSETVLFLWGVARAGGGEAAGMVAGGLAGVAGGVLVGRALYAGLLRIPLRWFFAATATLVVLLAAGMASQAAGFLIQADVLPSLAAPLWDSSRLLADDSIPGTLLHSLVGYDARPDGMQVFIYVAVVAAIAAGMRWTARAAPGA